MNPSTSTRPWWERPALWGVLVLSTALNTWVLSINQWANTYYSATVLGMTRSWKAFFFGAFDEHSFITVDKPPLALWVQALSARLFGFNTWSLLLPEAIAAVVTVWVVHRVVRRGFGPVAATVGATTLALTPIVVVMARHNNPDTLLVLLLSLALWAVSNAIRSGGLAPLLWSAVAVGLAFNTKMFQAYFVLPVIAIVYFVAARPRWPRKLLNLGIATGVLGVVSLSWILAVDLTPAEDRPYVGGSTNNTASELLVGYNGFGRLTGQEHIASPGMMGGAGPSGPPGQMAGPIPGPEPGGMPGQIGGPGGGPMGGMSDGGWTRLVTGEVANQIAWLFPLAAFGAVAVVVWLWRRPRHDVQRADFLLWAGTLVVTAVVFSFASGIWHTYYTVALGAPLAAVVGIGVVAMTRLARATEWWGLLLPVSIASTGIWNAYLLGNSPGVIAWVAPLVLLVTVVAAITMAIPMLLPQHRRGPHARLIAVAAVVGLLGTLSGPAAYAVTPLSTSVSATFPAAGPSGGFPDRSGRPAMRPEGARPDDHPQPGERPPPAESQLGDGVVRYLTAHHGGEKWLVAVVGSMVAAPIVLNTGQPVMAVGGYNGNDPVPQVEQLREYIHNGQLRFVWTSGSSGVRAIGPGELDTRVVDESMKWVASRCVVIEPNRYGGQNPAGEASTQLYDCAGAQ